MEKLPACPSETSREAREEEPIECGQWYWVKGDDDKGDWLGCVTHIGSNYFRVSSPPSEYSSSSTRVHFDRIDEDIARRELNPDAVINKMIRWHQHQVDTLLDKIKQLTAKLGLTPAGELGDGTTTTALVAVHDARDVKAHKKALIKAKEKTLPDLFKKVEEEHKEMARWMKAKLLPLKAEAKILKTKTESIEDRIFIVELYAGLCEEVVRIRKGEPASNDEKVHLFQRRHYMDEECLLDYDAGGMEFHNIRDFDRWLMRKSNRERILPMPKCVVAFQVRREKKHREAKTLEDFIRFLELAAADESTFLYMRNGDSYYRLSTGIDFGEQLFPDEARSHLMGGKMWVQEWGREIITDAEHAHQIAEQKRKKREFKEKHAAWKKLPKAEKDKTHEPWYHEAIRDTYIPLTPDTVYYDDGMAKIEEETRHHNRIAVVLQGLLDRSPVFHPHPPWKLWTPEGFSSGIELHHDGTRGITVGDPPDFEAYRSFVNTAIEKGTHTTGQRLAWMRYEAKKENDRQSRDWRIRSPIQYTTFTPYGNPGPRLVEKVDAISKGGCVYRWKRERLIYKPYVDEEIPTSFRCPIDLLLNVDAYSKGDFRQFYEDPRTRAGYLKWAPLLLAAEDFVSQAGKKR
jgi:hypothetical protein